MSTSQLPPDFSWVRERAKCSTAEVFKRLQLEAERDVEAANSVFELAGFLEFRITTNSAHDVFIAAREGHPTQIKFSLGSGKIHVKRDGQSDLEITLTLNNNGQCRLKVNGEDEELEVWQVLRMSLENLFFGEGTTPGAWTARGYVRGL
jgi:hypothetical protein